MVSIITINYNGYCDTCELIDSLKLKESYPHEIIVVDNASAGNDAELLSERYPHVRVLASEYNLGFAGGNNLALREAQGEYILFMNNDMVVHTPMLEGLVARQVQSGVGAVSPKIKYEYAPDVIQYAGYTAMTSIRISNDLIGVGQQDTGQFDVACHTPFIHGACVLTSRAVIDRVGGMAELYFLFYEELDWSIELRKQGYELWYEPACAIYHKESMTIKRGSPIRCYYLTRSRMLFTRRHRQGYQRVLALVYQLCFSYPVNVVRCLLRGDFSMLLAISRGMWAGLITSKTGHGCRY